MQIEQQPQRPQATAAQNWILFFCWTLPGAALIGGFFLTFVLTYSGGGKWDVLWPLLLVGPSALVAIGCGFFSSLIKITLEEGRNWITPKKIFWKTLSFFLLQIIISPFVAIAISCGCALATSVFSV